MTADVFYEHASELARVSNVFEVAGTPTDPTTITLIITSPTGTQSIYTYAATEITRTGAGAYYKDISCTESGHWQFVWVGTGAATDVSAGTWTVQEIDLQRLYCTPEEFKTRTRIDDELDDFMILEILRSSSRSIDAICERRFDRVTETRTFETTVSAWRNGEISVDDLVSITTLKTDEGGDGTYETTWTDGVDYQKWPLNPNSGPELRPYTRIKVIGDKTLPFARLVNERSDRLQIAGVWGWPAVPDPVRHACALIASDAFKLKDAPFGIAGLGEFGGMRVRDNPRAMSLLAPYRRHRILVG